MYPESGKGNMPLEYIYAGWSAIAKILSDPRWQSQKGETVKIAKHSLSIKMAWKIEQVITKMFCPEMDGTGPGMEMWLSGEIRF